MKCLPTEENNGDHGEDREEDQCPLGPAPTFSINNEAPNDRTMKAVSMVIKQAWFSGKLVTQYQDPEMVLE
jgi:hypothetical protein